MNCFICKFKRYVKCDYYNSYCKYPCKIQVKCDNCCHAYIDKEDYPCKNCELKDKKDQD